MGAGTTQTRGAIGRIEVDLSEAQLRLVRGLVDTHQAMGDCELHGYTLRFADYEGAVAFQGGIYTQGRLTTRDYVSLSAIDRKFGDAIVRAMQARKALEERTVA